jgi:hypothetical protein
MLLLHRYVLHYRQKWVTIFPIILTLILLTWSIRWAPNNASKWQMGFNSVFKRLIYNMSGQNLTEWSKRQSFMCHGSGSVIGLVIETCVWSQGYEIFCRESGTGTGFSLSTVVFSYHYQSTNGTYLLYDLSNTYIHTYIPFNNLSKWQ